MFDISLLIHTNQSATNEQLQAIVRKYSQIGTYEFDSHPDVFLLTPLADKASISIDQVHRLHEQLYLSPMMGAQKVILVHPAHALTIPAQQAMLKLVEEPPSKVLFILVSHTPYVLLPTILSRCRVISFAIQAGQGSEKIILPKNHAEAIKLSDEHGAKKETALTYINGVINSDAGTGMKKEAVKALGLLNKNINAKLALDQFLFNSLK